MANKTPKQQRDERQAALAEQKNIDDAQVVTMIFKEPKYYKDPTTPHFLPGVEYKIERADMIQRWLKRGGEIVRGSIPSVEVKHNPSVVVPNEHTEQKPFNNAPETKVEGDKKESDSEPNEDGIEEVSLDGEDQE